MNLNVLLLACSQSAMMTVVSLSLSASALVGAQLASPELATTPLAALYLATMLLLYPIARLMESYGRQKIFLGGALIGALGLAMAAVGIASASFTLFVAAGLLIGAFNAAGQYYRFAAAEAVPAQHKSMAISLTLSGGVIAAIAGPMLARWSKDALAPAFYASFLALIGVALLGAMFAAGLKLPPPTQTNSTGSRRPLREIAKNPQFVLAVAGGLIGYAIMGLLMCATPLAMKHVHLEFFQTATVIQWHVVAMFAPSFVTGAIIQRIGTLPVMLLGCGLMLGSIFIAMQGDGLAQFELSLILLGAGWNFLYVGATALLTETYHPEEKSMVQACNDTVVFFGMAVATLLTGKLVAVLGWHSLNVYAAIPVILLAAAIVLKLARSRAP
ncbi:MAG: MFS transporter [Nitrosomonadales bacterium]|nr:MFS transporter [Nitrosomonadales bacterium]